MLIPQIFDRAYITEVIRTNGKQEKVVELISRIMVEDIIKNEMDGYLTSKLKLMHSFVPSRRRHHGITRIIKTTTGENIEIPRKIILNGIEQFLYDIIVIQCDNDVAISVPFHGLAEELFPDIDDILAGNEIKYEKINISNLVIKLGTEGNIEVLLNNERRTFKIGLTHCQLSYSAPKTRSYDINKVTMSGENLGASEVYRNIIKPVVEPEESFKVTPILLGFAIFEDNVKKSSATTDRHGNFKVWISPGLRQLQRLFGLLKVIESIGGVVFTTNNLPILQSREMKESQEI